MLNLHLLDSQLTYVQYGFVCLNYLRDASGHIRHCYPSENMSIKRGLHVILTDKQTDFTNPILSLPVLQKTQKWLSTVIMHLLPL